MTGATQAMQPPATQPFATWNPTRGIWETTQLDLYGLSAPFSAIWPTCGWMRDGSAYRLPLSALLTTASASSSSPTARFRTPPRDRLHTWRRDPGPGAGQARDDRAIAPDHRLRPPRTAWLTEQEARVGDAVVTDRRTIQRWGHYADAITRWEHITGRPRQHRHS